MAIQKLEGTVELLREESESIERKGFTYFSRLNSDMSRLAEKMEARMDQLHMQVKTLNGEVRQLESGFEGVQEENRRLKVETRSG